MDGGLAHSVTFSSLHSVNSEKELFESSHLVERVALSSAFFNRAHLTKSHL
jgi:hypothetical protein